MKTIELDKDKKGNTFFVVTFPYEPEIVEAIKQIPNS